MADVPIFRLEAKLKNNRLVRARLEAGFRSVVAAARAIGVAPGELCGLETMNKSPRHPKGFRSIALKVATFYGYPPEYLWPDALDAVRKTTAVLEMSEGQVGQLLSPGRPPPPDAALVEGEGKLVLSEALATLSPREREVLAARFADEPLTLVELGATMSIAHERVRQIQEGALNKLRWKLHVNRDGEDVLRAWLRLRDG